MATISKTFPILLLTERFFLRFLRLFGFPEEDGRREPFAPEGRVCLVPEGRVCLTPFCPARLPFCVEIHSYFKPPVYFHV